MWDAVLLASKGSIGAFKKTTVVSFSRILSTDYSAKLVSIVQWPGNIPEKYLGPALENGISDA